MTFTPVYRVLIASITLFTCLIGSQTSSQAQNPPGAVMPEAGQDGFSQDSRQLVSTFVDPRTGQQYGRYIIYETVAVDGYEQREVTEKQWVPEWVTDQRTTTQISYVPIVTYQLQLQTERTLNPFVQPRQTWQYVPIVQYQANPVKVNQPVTYQRFVEKDIKKIVPVLVSQNQRVPRFADAPLNGVGNPTNTTVAAGVPNNAVAAQFPTRPLYSTNFPNQGTLQPPPAYYPATPAAAVAAQSGVAPNAAIASMPAYNPNIGGSGTANPLIASRQMGNTSSVYTGIPPANNGIPTFQNPIQTAGTPYGTSPYGVYPNTSTPYSTTTLASRPQVQWPKFMSQTGSLFQGGLFRNNPSAGTQYVASNPTPFGNGTWIQPTTNTAGTTWNNSGGASFVPRSPTDSLYGNSNSWNMVPVNNYRDPSQSGIPASVLR